ncbi:YbbR-like domain-containing protein [Turicibacter sp. TJ11]|uniref:CdaR family protein n=1 Tax=Turicibacter sp. TJ11 TaxID=2806443 RepID=UPI001F29998A|nr:CdaR family protein [Turicibacter sp. TJ11]
MKKSKRFETNERNETKDSGEVAKQIAVETIKDTEKFFQKISSFLKNIWKFLTTPSMLLGVFKFQKLDHVYESFLRNERLMKILALIVAIGFALNVRYSFTMKERYSVDINSYPLVSYYDKERTVVEGLPDTVDITLVGDKSQVDIAKTKANFEIFADLRDLPPGTHKVNLEYSKLGSKLDVKIDPSTIVVTIMPLTEIDKQVQADFVNLDQIDDMYVLSEPQLALDTVKIKGPQTTVDQVASVKAIIDVSDLSKLSDYEAPVFAYDKLGNKLDVEIKPDKLTASVQVTTPSKVVPIEAVVTGNAPDGYSVESVVLTPSEVKLYGETNALEDYEKLQIQVDLYQLDDNNELIVKLEKPENVHKMDTDTVKVKVIFEQTQTKVLENVAVDFKNLDDSYRVKVKDLVDSMMNVTLKGSMTILDSISNDDVKVSIDLFGYKAGEYEVPVAVEAITGVIIQPSQSKVNVIITK